MAKRAIIAHGGAGADPKKKSNIEKAIQLDHHFSHQAILLSTLPVKPAWPLKMTPHSMQEQEV